MTRRPDPRIENMIKFAIAALATEFVRQVIVQKQPQPVALPSEATPTTIENATAKNRLKGLLNQT